MSFSSRDPMPGVCPKCCNPVFVINAETRFNRNYRETRETRKCYGCGQTTVTDWEVA